MTFKRNNLSQDVIHALTLTLVLCLTLLSGCSDKEERRCVKMRTFFFYAQSPDFHKQGLCYYLKILYL